jgi:crotonobetainyl-CoA:carnitine CoA-transferase CaiB-like acyl-CoA transferase
MAYHTAEGMLMLGASNLRQQKRLWTVLERLDLIKRTNDERDADHEREAAVLTETMLARTAAEWEVYLQQRHVPASRVRTMAEALEDPQLGSRGLLHRAEGAPGIEGSFTVPVAAFKFGHDGPRVDRPPPMFGQHNDEVLGELGYSTSEIAGFRSAKII